MLAVETVPLTHSFLSEEPFLLRTLLSPFQRTSPRVSICLFLFCVQAFRAGRGAAIVAGLGLNPPASGKTDTTDGILAAQETVQLEGELQAEAQAVRQGLQEKYRQERAEQEQVREILDVTEAVTNGYLRLVKLSQFWRQPSDGRNQFVWITCKVRLCA